MRKAIVKIAKFTPAQIQSYEDSLKYYRDLKNSLDTAKEEGREEGCMEGREVGRMEGRMEGREVGREEKAVEIARELLKNGMRLSQKGSLFILESYLYKKRSFSR